MNFMRHYHHATAGRGIQPVLLVILDGFGLKKPAKDNAITRADAPTIKSLFAQYPWMRLDPSGEAVGLPRHQMGTSEVGHLNIGAGRVVDQDLVRINKAVEVGAFLHNKALLDATAHASRPGAALHLIGLCSDGGVHSHIDHLFALLELAHHQHVRRVFIHAVTDGRDTEAKVAKKYIQQIERRCAKLGVGEIATVMGRYYAMDRDNRWDRELRAYDALTLGKGLRAETPVQAVDDAYRRGEGDEFIQPTIVRTREPRTSAIIDGDSVIFFNFRQDRARQLTHGFTDLRFKHFKRKRLDLLFTTFTSYDKQLNVPVAFPPENVENGLAEWLAGHKVRQFHTAETEKYAHVTYFFNGGRETPYYREDRKLVPSPRVATYDLQPEMSAAAVTEQVVGALRSGLYGFIVVNFANADMVGHTGKLTPTIAAVETLDTCLLKLEIEAELRGYVLLITADHGNAEEMSGKYQTSHTLNNVPLIVVDKERRYALTTPKRVGKLADIAPTILAIMRLPKPREMDGAILVQRVKN